ncbi:nucleolar protein 6-like [Trifolium pratense]|uniref:nucleolar protein 6-like n=1 Tax=Trifolium pratense TaxID=57577 RepID=UPI001E695D59|nr:nucleolar protein 6-like [Trifolium pratense]XP_045792402.1 nucleolar protein 6-like [Trifolium pratense]
MDRNNLQLEGSRNWPMDEIAIEKTKSSFLIQIGESLQKKWGMTCTATEDDVDVLMSGYAFRLKLLHERALSLIGSDQKSRVYSADKKLLIRSQHASMINGLQSRYPIYGPVVRLAKRWAASHLFSACLVEEAIELLVAYLFLNPLPFDVPCSRITGFLSTNFLKNGKLDPLQCFQNLKRQGKSGLQWLYRRKLLLQIQWGIWSLC